MKNLLRSLPDEPVWVDIRGMLRSGHAELTGGASVETGFVVRVRHGAQSVVGVVGRPPVDAIARALDDITDMTPLVAQVGNADYVQQSLDASRPEHWSGEIAIMHALSGPAREVRVPPPAFDTKVRLLTHGDPLDHLPPGLRHEMTHARLLGPVGAAFADGLPVSFCYPVWTTEALWDVSIDTVESHRRRSLAVSAVGFMVEQQRHEGREPVWGALASNAPSLRLAAKLGFAPVGEIVVFSKGQWAYLTAGF